MGEKLNHEEFITQAIVKLRTGSYRGIHSVYSGFNEAFKRYYSEDPVAATTKLASEGKILIVPAKGGVMLYLPGESPAKPNRGEEALKKMGLV